MLIQSSLLDTITKEEFNAVVAKTKNKSYYACYPVFYSFLNFGRRSCEIENSKIVVTYKNNRYSLFEKSLYNYLYLQEQQNKGDDKEKEYVIDTKWASSLPYKRLKWEHKYVKKTYTLIVKQLSDANEEQISHFLGEWKEEREHYFRLATRRDYKLLEIKNSLQGIVILDKDIVVGVTAFCAHPIFNELSICILGKALNRYKNLNSFLAVETYKLQYEMGFKFSNDSCANTPGLHFFKSKFMGGEGFFNIIYSTNEKK